MNIIVTDLSVFLNQNYIQQGNPKFNRLENLQNKEKAILEALSEPFKIDETMWMLSSELAEKTNIADYNELETLVEGLNESGLVDVPVRAVKEFAVRLTKAGLSFLQKQNKSP